MGKFGGNGLKGNSGKWENGKIWNKGNRDLEVIKGV